MPVPANPAAVVRSLGGTASWAQLEGVTTQHALRRALDRGELVRLRRGVYAVADAPDARQVAAAVGGVLAGPSAAQDLLWPLLVAPERVQVAVPRSASPPPDERAVVRWVDLEPSDVWGPTTSPLRTALDCAALLPRHEALAAVDSALRHGAVTPDDLRRAARRCHSRGALQARWVAAHADARAANPFESALRAVVLEAGLTGFVPQLEVAAGGRAMRVDLGDPALRVVLEADSFEHHGSRNALVRDCRRYDVLVAAGWLVLRFAWEQVMFQRDWVRDMVVATCALRRTSAA